MLSEAIFVQLSDAISALEEKPRKDLVSKVNAVFEIAIKDNSTSPELVWTINLKNATISKGSVQGLKPDITISVQDSVFADLYSGKTTGQKAFMGGKLKIKGTLHHDSFIHPNSNYITGFESSGTLILFLFC